MISSGEAMRAGRPRLRSHGCWKFRNAQVRYRKTREPGLGLGAAAGGPLIANLAAGAGGRARKRRDRGRMVVGLDFHQDIDRLVAAAVDAAVGVREPTRRHAAGDHRGIVAIGGQHARRCASVGVADHRKQGFLAHYPVDDELRIEDLVAAVFRVRLGEHHELHVAGVASEALEGIEQVVDFCLAERQPQAMIGFGQCAAAFAQRDNAAADVADIA